MSTSETGSQTVAPNVEASDLEGIIDPWFPPARDGSLFIDSPPGPQVIHPLTSVVQFYLPQAYPQIHYSPNCDDKDRFGEVLHPATLSEAGVTENLQEAAPKKKRYPRLQIHVDLEIVPGDFCIQLKEIIRSASTEPSNVSIVGKLTRRY
jgi:hypothetical protein